MNSSNTSSPVLVAPQATVAKKACDCSKSKTRFDGNRVRAQGKSDGKFQLKTSAGKVYVRGADGSRVYQNPLHPSGTFLINYARPVKIRGVLHVYVHKARVDGGKPGKASGLVRMSRIDLSPEDRKRIFCIAHCLGKRPKPEGVGSHGKPYGVEDRYPSGAVERDHKVKSWRRAKQAGKESIKEYKRQNGMTVNNYLVDAEGYVKLLERVPDRGGHANSKVKVSRNFYRTDTRGPKKVKTYRAREPLSGSGPLVHDGNEEVGSLTFVYGYVRSAAGGGRVYGYMPLEALEEKA